jgi:DNA-3-methyladenine glycosylase II
MARTPKPKDPWAKAIAHLRKVDPDHFKPLIKRVGPCLLRPTSDRFATLVRAIIGQQISSRAAAAIDGRFRTLAGEPYVPARVLALGEEALRSVGLSGVKARYLLNLSEAVAGGTVPLDRFDDWEDEAIIASLTSVKGIGVWTAEMFLVFALNRPDVLAVGDFGIRVALRNRFGLAELPKPGECRALTEPWRPFRSIAMWYLWRGSDTAKQSKPA